MPQAMRAGYLATPCGMVSPNNLVLRLCRAVDGEMKGSIFPDRSRPFGRTAAKI
jgi:hypothetical protein